MSITISPILFPNKMKRPVNRCLFGRSTPEQNEKDFLIQEMRQSDKDTLFREKWGLDPITGSTVNDAEYECVPVDFSKESLPSFYTKGYAPRKPRPVVILRRERSSPYGRCLNFDTRSSPKPQKRRYSSDVENDSDQEEKRECRPVYCENSEHRVPVDGVLVVAPSNSIPHNTCSSSYSPSTIFSSIVDINRPADHLSLSPCLPDTIETTNCVMMSPRSTDQSTPQQRPRSLTQKTMKDYLQIRKPRCPVKNLKRN